MSGHNKWSKIKHKKAASDIKKSKAFSRLTKLITAESRRSGGDITSPGLRAAIDQAKLVNLPSQNIQRAIDRGSGVGDVVLSEVWYEMYGPENSVLRIQTLTDNKNRTAAEIRSILSKKGFVIAKQNSTSWMFDITPNNTKPKEVVALPADKLIVFEELLQSITNDSDDVQKIVTNVAGSEVFV